MVDKSRIAGFGVGALENQCKRDGVDVYDMCSVFRLNPSELDVLVVDLNSINLRCRQEVERLIARWQEENSYLEIIRADNLDDVLADTNVAVLKAVESF